MAAGDTFGAMTHSAHICALAALIAVFASSAHAACTAEYKAKQDNPLRLEHGTLSVPGPCTLDAATPKVKAALKEKGWTLLKVLSVSDG